MSANIRTLEDIFGLWDTIPEMADEIGENTWRVSKWKQRGRIPFDNWGPVIDAVRRKGEDLSTDDLLHLHGAPLPKRRSQRADA